MDRQYEINYNFFVSEIQAVFHHLAELSIDQVLLGKTKQKYGL